MIHITGFEEFAGEQSPASALARADYITAGTLALVAGRFGSGISTQGGMLSRKMPWTTNRFSTGFAHQFSDRGSVARLKIGASTLVLWMNPDNGMPMVNDQMGGALPTKNRWYYFEMQIERAGQVTVFINGRQEMTFTLAALTAQEVEVGLGWVDPTSYRPAGDTPLTDTAAKTYDDFYMRDDTHLGPISVTTRFPNQDAHVEWFNTDAGTASHANTVSLHPPQPLDHYLASAVIGAEDRFKSIQPLVSNNAVVATGIVVMARKSPTFDAKLGVFIGGDAENRAGARTVGADWKTQYVCFEAVASDTPDKITTSEFGFNVTAP